MSSQPERINHLLKTLSLDAKLHQLGAVMLTDVTTDGELDPTKLNELLSQGVGELTRAGALSGQDAAGTARLVSEVQTYLTENAPEGIPAIFHDECAGGFTALGATTFPHPIGLGATFDPELVEAATSVIREQMLAVGVQHGLSPVLDVARDPRWGRVEETFGEDTFLTTQLGVAYVRGLQGENLAEGVVATGKHFLGHGSPQGGRNWAPCLVPERTLLEEHAPPFHAAIREAGLGTVMNAYHDWNGVPCGASKALLTDLLRDKLGFEGLVVSDYHTVKTLCDYHFVAEDEADAAAQALEAGIDVELPRLDYYRALGKAVKRNLITEASIDRAVRRVLELKANLGLLDGSLPKPPLKPFNTPKQRQLTREAAQKSVVLLKNENGVLPLQDLKTIAVIGPGGDTPRLMQGDYHFPSHQEDLYNSVVANPDNPNPEAVNFTKPMMENFTTPSTLLEGVRGAAPDADVRYAKGCGISDQDRSGFDEAVALAREAEVVIMALGERSGLSKRSTSGESRDRTRLGLPGVQQDLLEAVVATGTLVVVVLLTGRPLALPWLAEHVPAALCAFLPAQEGGHAIADVLFGKVSPGGRLPISFPRHVGQVPIHYSLNHAGARSHWQGEYVDESVKPLYAFGHGLSYTKFDYSGLELSASKVSSTDTLLVSLSVKNVGSVAGDEVVQLYIRDLVASVTRPLKLLKGFKRLHLTPGQSAKLTFTLDVQHLAFYNREMVYVVEPGEIKLMLGAAADDVRLEATFSVTGETQQAEHVFFTPCQVERS